MKVWISAVGGLPDDLYEGGLRISVHDSRDEALADLWELERSSDAEAPSVEREVERLFAMRGLTWTIEDRDIPASAELTALLRRLANAFEQRSYPELQGIACEVFSAIDVEGAEA